MSSARAASLSHLAHFAFMPLPNFTMIAFANAIEVLRMANYLGGGTLYRWSVISPEGGTVAASNGLSVETGPIDCAGRPDIVFVCGGVDVQHATRPEHLAALRRFARMDIALGSLCTGTYALVKAGLLAGYDCAIHWENMLALKEAFPETRFLKELFVVDRDRVTCTGGVAPLDMMLHLIAPRVGMPRVAQIAEQFIVEHVRDTGAQQRMPLVAHLGSANKSLFEVVSLMESNIEEPLSREELARLVSMSQRQLQRLFREHLGMTPTHYYLSLRLRRARELLLQTDLSIMHITMACGFQSACHFSKSYHNAFGIAPTRERRAHTQSQEDAKASSALVAPVALPALPVPVAPMASAVQVARAAPAMPSMSVAPVVPMAPAVPTACAVPVMPSMPVAQTVPMAPAVPAACTVPAMPSMPRVPVVPVAPATASATSPFSLPPFLLHA